MTVAVCWNCGEMKWGAFNPCPKCKAAPGSEDELAVSLVLSDHYQDKPTMERIGMDIAAGQPAVLDPETRLDCIKNIRDMGLYPDAARATDIDYTPPPVEKPWWKKIF